MRLWRSEPSLINSGQERDSWETDESDSCS